MTSQAWPVRSPGCVAAIGLSCQLPLPRSLQCILVSLRNPDFVRALRSGAFELRWLVQLASSRQDPVNNFAVYIRESAFDAVVIIGQPFVVDSQEL
jgi:hypothetical protein